MKISDNIALLVYTIGVKIADIHFPKTKGGRAVFEVLAVWWGGILMMGIVIFLIATRG